MKRALLFIILLVFNSLLLLAQQQRVNITGLITTEDKQPLPYVTIKLNNLERTTYTDKFGHFGFSIAKNTEASNIQLIIQMVGKKSIDTTISSTTNVNINLVLKDLNLSLNEVQVSAIRKSTGLSNSSIVIDRQAIEQAQAFSLTDILNNLPGKQYSALDLQSPKNLTLRTAASGNVAMNNALGTAIIMDGIAQSNNANMQSKNIGQFGLRGSIISDNTNSVDYDVTFGGIDLREIPADNIESIEVISGVAPAQYGDLTDGAVIINRQAGKTNYQFNSRINGGSTNFSLSKGYQLNKNLGFLNINFNYLISNNDPRDDLKKYDRVSGGLMYTNYFSQKIKNTFSFDYSAKLDDAKMDPDDGAEKLTYSKNRRMAFANRTSIEFTGNYLRRINLNVGADFGFQDTYSQWYLNGSVKAMANKDTTGVYEGFYIPGNYLAVDQVVGKPKNFNANLSFLSEINTGKLKHLISYGASISASSNKGQGVLYDPERPRFANQGNRNERPYNFELIPSLLNTGIYIEDKFKFNLLDRNFGITAGMRYDNQNGFGSFQPRINAIYNLTKHFNFNIAYGIASKAPTMSYRYPGPTYFDIPLIDYYTGDVRNSLLLVYTHKYIPDHSGLRPSKSGQLELGLSYNSKFLSASIYGYSKNNKDGFSAQSTLFSLKVPEYQYTEVPGKKPTYAPTGNQLNKTGLTVSSINNNANSRTNGIELFVSTKKIRAIQTSFSFNSTYINSDFKNSSAYTAMAEEKDILAGKKAWIGLYYPLSSNSTVITSKLNTDTHIPKLGFVISLYYDFNWASFTKLKTDNVYPYAYLDKDNNYFPISNFDKSNPDYGHLRTNLAVNTRVPFKYGNLSMRLSKELKNKIRFSVNAYNVLNLRPRFYDDIQQKLLVYNDPISIGAELSIKF